MSASSARRPSLLLRWFGTRSHDTVEGHMPREELSAFVDRRAEFPKEAGLTRSRKRSLS